MGHKGAHTPIKSVCPTNFFYLKLFFFSSDLFSLFLYPSNTVETGMVVASQ